LRFHETANKLGVIWCPVCTISEWINQINWQIPQECKQGSHLVQKPGTARTLALQEATQLGNLGGRGGGVYKYFEMRAFNSIT
jgi:uncharacterized protein YjcR